MLMAHRPARVGGPYAEVGPIFVHAQRCDGCQERGAFPEGFRHRHLILRAYDSDGRQGDNQMVEGRRAEAGITALFSRDAVAFPHPRNVLPGCFMFSVTRSWGPQKLSGGVTPPGIRAYPNVTRGAGRGALGRAAWRWTG